MSAESDSKTMLKSFYKKDLLEAGLDEVGRGSLVGRVYAAAVIWPDDPEILAELGPRLQIKDSKKLSARQRAILEDFIHTSLCYSDTNAWYHHAYMDG